MPSKLWDVMNDLEMVTSKIVSAREIIDAAAEAIQRHEYSKAETLTMAAYEFLGYYLDDFDEKFKLAWKETVVKQKEQEEDHCMPAWRHSDMEYLSKVCDKDDTSPECKKAWSDFWNEQETIQDKKFVTQYTEEELNAMCDKAASDEEKERCLEYNVRESEYYNIDPKGNQVPVKRWILPVEEDLANDDVYVTFPEDLLEAADLKEGDQVEWIDNGDGSWIMKKRK